MPTKCPVPPRLHHVVHAAAVRVEDDVAVLEGVEQEGHGVDLRRREVRVPRPQDEDVPVPLGGVVRLVGAGRPFWLPSTTNMEVAKHFGHDSA